MSRVICASGPVVEALRRHDHGLRVRWSFEKKKWAVEAPIRRGDGLVPPVVYERVGQTDQWMECLMPELSDRYISFHDGRYIVCWSEILDWRLYHAVVLADTSRMRGGIVGEHRRAMADRQEAGLKARRARADERSYLAYDKFRFLNRKQPWNDPAPTGMMKEDVMAAQARLEKRYERLMTEGA